MAQMIEDQMRVYVLGLSQAERDWLEERAGILEFDAGMSRRDAERMAYRLAAAEFGFKCLLEE